MATYAIGVANGSDIYSFTEAVLNGLDLADKATVEFDELFIAITGPNGNKLNIKGEFAYKRDAEGLPDTEFASLRSGTVSSMTLVQNPGIVKYTVINSFSIDALALLDLLLAGDAGPLYAALGDMKFLGNEGGDVSKGSGGNDMLFGLGGDDDLSGGDGHDEIEGGAGADAMTGGAGTDTLLYKSALSGVSVSLDGAAALGDAEGDTFTGFENLVGSDFGDSLSGNAGVNIIAGGSGDDWLSGGAGGDTLEGGGDADTASYAGSAAGVTVSLFSGAGLGGDAQGDTLTSIEHLEGSAHGDQLTGSNAANTLNGGRGDDTLDGGLGIDTLIGRGGRDALIGGNGNDFLNGGAGGDSFVLSDLATSTDTIVRFVSGKDELRISAADFKGDLVAGQTLTDIQFEVNNTGLASSRDVRFVFNSATGELVFDTNGSGEDGARVIAVFQTPFPALGLSDFEIV